MKLQFEINAFHQNNGAQHNTAEKDRPKLYKKKYFHGDDVMMTSLKEDLKHVSTLWIRDLNLGPMVLAGC